MKRTCLAFLGLVGALAAGCGHTGTNSPEGWNSIKSKHFTVYTATPREALEPLNGMEYKWAALASSFFKNTELNNVEMLYLDGDDFRHLFGHRREWAAMASVPGGGKLGKDGLIVLHRKDDDGSASQGGLASIKDGASAGQKDSTSVPGNDDESGAEALAHLFIQKSFPDAPLWFHEGFAAYVRSVEYNETDDGGAVACYGKPSEFNQTFIPLEKLFTLKWDDYDSTDARGWFKHSSRILFDYTVHAQNGKYAPGLGVIVEGIASGKPGTEIMKAAFADQSLEQLNKNVSAHGVEKVKRSVCPLPFPIVAEKAADVADSRDEKAVPVEDMKALLDGIRKLPLRDDGYPGWYPPEVIAKIDGGGAPAK